MCVSGGEDNVEVCNVYAWCADIRFNTVTGCAIDGVRDVIGCWWWVCVVEMIE